MRSATPLALASLILATSAVATMPLANAGHESSSFVGSFLVDASGRVTGASVLATLDESDGIVVDYAPVALGAAPVFERVTIDGFAQAQKLQGVGTSALVLRGDAATLTLHDDARAALEVATSAPTKVHFQLAPRVLATATDGAQGAVRLADATTGRTLGWLVAVGADGDAAASRDDALHVRTSEVVADAQAGSRIVFLARSDAPDAASFDAALAKAAAEGLLASSFVTDLSASEATSSTLDLLGRATSRMDGAASIATHVRGSAEGAPALLAYDLAYETLPARSASQVAVFVDGALAERADAPSLVHALATRGRASYHATLAEAHARSLILVSVPPGDHDVAILADATGGAATTEAQARAGHRAETIVRGLLSLHGAKATGAFLTASIDASRSTLVGYTSLATQTKVFDAVTLDGVAAAKGAATGDLVGFATSTATLSLHDDADGTLTIDAQRPAHARFDLAPGVRAVAAQTAAASSVLRLEGPHGYAGFIIAGPGATLKADAGRRVTATLADDARVLVRSVGGAGADAAFATASDAAIANAIARGEIGAQLLAGRDVDGSIATTHVETALGIASGLAATGRGELTASYHSSLDTARSFVFEQRSAAGALAVKSADDVRVLVDGAPAFRAPSLQAALDARAAPAFHAESAADGALRLVVNTLDGDATVAFTKPSSFDVAALASGAAQTPAFGSFRVFDDGAAVGDFVSLRVDSASGALAAFHPASLDAPVFSSVATSGRSSAHAFTSAASAVADGSTTLLLDGPDARVSVSDTSDAVLSLAAKHALDATFQLSKGYRAEARGANVLDLVTATGADAGALILRGSGELAIGEHGALRARLDEGSAVLYKARAGLDGELSRAQRSMLHQAIARGALGGEVIVQADAAMAAALESSSLSGLVGSVPTAASVPFGDLQMVTASSRDRIDVTVESATHAGRTILITLDPSSLPDVAAGRARILVDGVATAEAASLADVLDATDDADAGADCGPSASSAPGACGVAEAFVLAGDAGTQVLVSLPHFSAHTVTLEAARPPQGGWSVSTTLAIILGLLTAAETAYLVRNHRRN